MLEEFEKEKYLQTFEADYCIKFPFIKQSTKSINYPFYSADICYGCDSRNNVDQCWKKKNHIDNVEANVKK